jgi:hypothetical protein
MPDYSIALQGKPMQITSQEDYLKDIYALQNAQQANQLNKMVLGEKQRGMAEDEAIRNYFAQQDRTSPDFVKGLYGISPKTGQAYEKSQEDVRKERALTKSAELDQITKVHGLVKTGATRVLADPRQAVARAELQQIARQTGADMSAEFAQLDAIGENPAGITRWATGHALDADKQLEQHYVTQENVMVNGVPTTRVLQKPKYNIGPAITVEGSAAPTYNKPAASTIVNVDNKQESEFNKQLGGGQAKKVLEDKGKAEEAAQILATNQGAKNLLDKGMLTGVGAEFFTTLNQGLSQAGIDFGKANAAQNSQAFGALMAKNTAAIIKNFGAGTGISDADRIYAKQAAAGDITMDENAIREIIKVNDRVARAAIAKHNKNVSGIQTNVPLTVDVRDYTAGIPEGRSSTSAAKKGAKTLDDIFK